MNVSFSRRHTYVDASTGRTRTVPAGWSGDLPDDVAAAAIDAGHATSADMKQSKAKKAEPKKESGAA